MQRIAVTGGAGKAGRAVIKDLLDHGYKVTSLDLRRSETGRSSFLEVDLTDLGQVYEGLLGHDAVVHLAAIPAPGLTTEAGTFRVNTMSTYHVFQAAAHLGLARIVWASSETILGLPFDRQLPDYAPIDEDQPPYPESSYALSKLMGETMAHQFNRWTGIPITGLRYSNIMEPGDYQAFPSFWPDPRARKWNLWGYVDVRDVAQAARLALAAEVPGSEVCIIAAADTVMNRPSAELMAEVFPTVPIRGPLGEFDTLLAIEKAGHLLGYRPAYSWRDHLTER